MRFEHASDLWAAQVKHTVTWSAGEISGWVYEYEEPIPALLPVSSRLESQSSQSAVRQFMSPPQMAVSQARAATVQRASEQEEELRPQWEMNILAAIRQVVGGRRQLFGHSLPTTQDVFAAMDRDGDGMLDVREIGQALSRLDIPLTAEQLQTLSDDLDMDGSGAVDYREFAQMLHHHHRRHHRHHHHHHHHHQGG